MANTVYDNFFLANEIEDQYNSYLDLQQFCTIDNTLVLNEGMTKKIHLYKATDGVEKVTEGTGNSKSIGVSFEEKTYNITLAQGRFEYNDETAMKDPFAIMTGVRHLATDMFNTVNKDIFAEFAKATLSLAATDYSFGTFVDAVAKLDMEIIEGVPLFGIVSPEDMASVRKALNENLKYVEAFARNGYAGTVAGINLYTKKDATAGTIYVGNREAVTVFNKSGVELESILKNNRSSEDANVRKNTIYTRKYYVAALTDATKMVKITVSPGV